MRVTARDGGLGESDVVLARTTRRPEGGIGFETYAHRDVGRLQARLERVSQGADVEARQLARRQQRRRIAFRPPAFSEQPGHRAARTAEDRRAFASRPRPGRQERLEGDCRAPERRADRRRIDGSRHGLSDFLTRKWLLFRLKRQVPDLDPGDGERPFVASWRPWWEPQVESPSVELRFGVVVVRHFEKDQPLRAGSSRPVSGDRVERHPAT